MTRAQYLVYNRLAKKQTNRQNDVQIVEQSESSVTFHVRFPGLYLTYGRAGTLLVTETEAERAAGSKRLAQPGRDQLTFNGELGGDNYGQAPPVTVDDDDVPF